MFSCPDGYFLVPFRGCSNLSGYCEPCSKCGVDEYPSGLCTGSNDTTCTSCAISRAACKGRFSGCGPMGAGNCIADLILSEAKPVLVISIDFDVGLLTPEALLFVQSAIANAFALQASAVTLSWSQTNAVATVNSSNSRSLLQQVTDTVVATAYATSTESIVLDMKLRWQGDQFIKTSISETIEKPTGVSTSTISFVSIDTAASDNLVLLSVKKLYGRVHPVKKRIVRRVVVFRGVHPNRRSQSGLLP
eukprot:144936-Hanusia_phi.AAC.7